MDTNANDVHFGDTNKDGQYVSGDSDENPYTDNLWTFHSFCSAHLEEKEQWGTGIGLADDVFLTVEEWTSVDTSRVNRRASSVSPRSPSTCHQDRLRRRRHGRWRFREDRRGELRQGRLRLLRHLGYNGNFGGKTEQLNRKKAQSSTTSATTTLISCGPRTSSPRACTSA